eukprot:gene14710-19771_t
MNFKLAESSSLPSLVPFIEDGGNTKKVIKHKQFKKSKLNKNKIKNEDKNCDIGKTTGYKALTRNDSLSKIKANNEHIRHVELQVDQLFDVTANHSNTLLIPTNRINRIETKDFTFPSDEHTQFSTNSRSKSYDMSSQASVSTSRSFSSYSSDNNHSNSIISRTSSLGTNSILTQREMLHDINFRASKGLDPPEYVTSLSELPIDAMNWNKSNKMHRSHHHHSNNPNLNIFLPPMENIQSNHSINNDDNLAQRKSMVNIIGCHHPIDLILAKADQRIRKRQEVIQKQKEFLLEKSKSVDELVTYRNSRIERYHAMALLTQRQQLWLSIIKICLYFQQIHPIYDSNAYVSRLGMKQTHAGLKIRKYIMCYYYKKQFERLKHFRRLVDSQLFKVIFKLRVQRKRRAVERMKKFLIDHNGKYRTKFIHHMIEQRENLKKKLRTTPMINADKFNIDPQFKLDMKAQALAWGKIDTEMRRNLKLLYRKGVIRDVPMEEIIDSMRINYDTKYQFLSQIVSSLRKEFYQSQVTIVRRQLEVKLAYSLKDASDLLSGRNEKIDQIIKLKFDKKNVVKLKYKPFMIL